MCTSYRIATSSGSPERLRWAEGFIRERYFCIINLPIAVQLLLGHTDGRVRVLQQAQFAFLAVERPAQIRRRVVDPFLLLRYRLGQGGARVLCTWKTPAQKTGKNEGVENFKVVHVRPDIVSK